MTLLRAIPLALAAFASVATSAIEETEYRFNVYDLDPADDDIDVSPAVQPSVWIVSRHDEPLEPWWIRLDDAVGSPVAGQAERHGTQLVFVPDRLLPPGDYRFVLALQDGMAVDGRLDADETRLFVDFTVRPPGVLASTVWDADRAGVELFFTSRVEPRALQGFVRCVDSAGEELEVLALAPAASAMVRIEFETPAESCVVEDGLLDHHGFPIDGLPVRF
jgi:hypothetical protein